MPTSKPSTKTELGRVLLLAALLLAAAPAWADRTDPYNTEPYNTDEYTTGETAEDSSYSFARVVEGPATVLAAGGERESLESHQPILVGDRLWVPQESRLEVVLADRNQLRLAGESEVVFHRIAYSADSDGRVTALELRRGRLQLVVPDDALGEALPQIDTPAATVYIHREGSFRISAGGGWTELVVRDGLAELVTENGSRLVHPGETGWAEGSARPSLDVRLAGRRDDLERWGDRLTAEAAYEVPYVDRSLRYAAAPLAEYGGWVEVGGRHAWRPRVEVAWRPYYRGYWRHTPVGLTWVSYDPWGYVTHHYGSWDYAPAYGWVWYPGRVYAPARVHWYWGPTYVGWIPSGYYGHHYRHRHGFGLHFGIYGWAGGHWDPWGRWTFAATINFGHRHYDRHGYGGRYDGDRHRGDRRHRDHGYRTGRELARERPDLERGIVTTDPRVPAKNGPEVYASLERKLTELRRERGRQAADVTDFVAKKPLSGDLAAAVLRKPAKPAADSRTAGDRGGWATGDRPLPTLSAVKPTAKPAGSVAAVRPSRYDKPASAGTTGRGATLGDRGVKPDRRSYDKPADAGRRAPTLSDRTAKPGTRSSTYSDQPGEVRPPAVRPPDVRKPSAPSPSERRTTARPGLSSRKPVEKPQPRASTPAPARRPTYKPTPRTSAPKPTYKPAPRSTPRASAPRPTSKPTTRRSAPRASAPKPTYKPAPRTAAPRASAPRPTPRASAPRPTHKPTTRRSAPRASPPKPTYKPAPRTAAPRASAPRPTPRTSAPKPSSRPAPRASAPPRSSRPAPKPAPRASSAPRPKPQVSKSPSRSSGSKAKPATRSKGKRQH